jgi:sulfide:quinone oxidoreductase
MAKVVVIGAGFAGHTAAVYLGNRLGRDHQITVINKFTYFLFLPSLIWVGIGRMDPSRVRIPLAGVYEKLNIRFIHGSASEIHVDENYLLAEQNEGGRIKVDYDYLIISTGPRLNYQGTPGLGPITGHTESVCWLDHAVECRNSYLECVERMRRGERLRIVVGAGHPQTGCHGAAFEYLTNIHNDLVRRKVRDRAELLWLSNEPALGDFGLGGILLAHQKGPENSEQYVRSIFENYGIKWEIRKGVKEIDEKRIFWEDYGGNLGESAYDFAMLIPQFLGQELKYVNSKGEDASARMVNKNGFVIVDGYYGLPYDSLSYTPEAWPATYQNPNYRNIFAAGVAFAMPGPISEPHTTPTGTLINAAPPRTGMMSGIIGRMTALNVISLVDYGKIRHQERLTEMYAACIASMNDSLWGGSALSILIYPVVPNLVRYPNSSGRDLFITRMETGLHGAWLKRLIHFTALHKMKSRPGWQYIPE